MTQKQTITKMKKLFYKTMKKNKKLCKTNENNEN